MSEQTAVVENPEGTNAEVESGIPEGFTPLSMDEIINLDTSVKEKYESDLSAWEKTVSPTVEEYVDDEEVMAAGPEGLQQEAGGSGEPTSTSQEPRKTRVQKRIDQLVRQNHEAREDLSKSQAEQTVLVRKVYDLETKLKEVGPAPTRENYESEEEYVDAKIEHGQTKATLENQKALVTEQANSAVTQSYALQSKRFATNLETGRIKYPDFDLVISSIPPKSVPKPFVDALHRQDNFVDLAYHLGQNPQEAMRIARLNQEDMILEIGRIGERIAQLDKSRRVKSNAPQPPSPIQSNSTGPKSVEDMSAEEYAKQANLKELKKRGRA